MAHVGLAASELGKHGKSLLRILVQRSGHGQTDQGLVQIQADSAASENIALHGIDAVQNLVRDELDFGIDSCQDLQRVQDQCT